MKHSLLLSLALTVMSASTAFGQLLIDKSIDLTGSGTNARVMGIKEVSDAEDAVSAEVLQKGGLIYATVTGGPNAYTLTFFPAISTPYNEGMVILFKTNGDNTGAVTINSIPLRKDVTNALAAGDVKDNQIVTVVYDGTNFQLASRTADSNSGGTVTSVSTAAANNGVTASWANPTTTPALTIGLGNITPSSVSTSGNITATGTITGSNLSGTNTGDQTLSGLGGVPTSRTININGTAHDLSANRTWSVGTVTSVSTAAANNGVTATWSMTSPTPALTIGLGNITPASVAATGTVTGSNLSGTNTGDQSLSGLGGVPTSRTITINGTTLDLSANRSWSVGTVTGTGTQNYVAKWNNAGGTAIGNSSIFDNGTLVGIGHAGPGAKLDVATGALGSNAGDVVEMLRLQGSNSNGSMLDIRQVRTSAGASWTSAGTRIQQKIDATWQAYMQFNGTGNDYGISFGTGGSTVAPGNVVERLKIDQNGIVTVSNLAGTGNRRVYADANGVLKTSTDKEWVLLYRDDFESNSTGWVANASTLTSVASGTFGRAQLTGGISAGEWVLTNFVTSGTANIVLKKSFDLSAVAHTEVMVKLTYYFVDSWDGNEGGWMGVAATQTTAPNLLATETFDVDNNYNPWLANSTYLGGAANILGLTNFSEKQMTMQGEVKYSGNTIWIMTGSGNLGTPTSDESFAIDNVEIYVR